MNNLLFLFLISFGSCALSQTYSLNDLIKLADSNNINLKNARVDIAMNTAQRNVYLSGRLPQISIQGDYRYNAVIPAQIVPADFFGGPAGTFAKVKFGVPFTLSNTVQLTQFLYNPQLSYGLAALDINAQITELQKVIATQEVIYQVSTTYFSLQAIQQQLEFAMNNERNMVNLIQNMNLMVQQGLIIPTEIDKLKMNKNSISNAMLKLENTRLQLLQYLKILVGINEDQTIEITKDNITSNPIIIDKNTISRPELELIRLQKQMNLEERKGTYNAYLPTLSFYTAYNYNYNLKPENNFRTGIPSAFLGLHLDWTIFDGLEKKNKLKINLYNREKIENQESLATKNLHLATENAKREILLQASNLEMNKVQLQLAEKVYAVSNSQYKSGTISTNELLQTDNNIQIAQSNLVGAYLQLRLAELNYLKSISQLK
jgi:outer membrane protein TolC